MPATARPTGTYEDAYYETFDRLTAAGVSRADAAAEATHAGSLAATVRTDERQRHTHRFVLVDTSTNLTGSQDIRIARCTCGAVDRY